MCVGVCVCGEVESEKHVLIYYNLYIDVRIKWKDILVAVHVDVYNDIRVYGLKMSVLKEKLCGIWIWCGILDIELSCYGDTVYNSN